MIPLTKIYGHRGSKGNYPENTLLSFQAAIDEGVDGLELDVHMTRDGEIVVIHDETLERTTDGNGNIKDLTLDEIKQYSAGIKFQHFPNYHPYWQQERVPTLEEVLQLLEGTDIELNIELKTYINIYPGIEEKLLFTMRQFGGNRKTVYSSFHLPSLIRLKQLDKDTNIAWLLHSPISNPSDYMQVFDLESFHLAKDLVSNDMFPDYQEMLPNVRVWTVNDEIELKKMLDIGVKAVITDYPEKAIHLRVRN
ncbi:glycerophosphoryl diester phosphodiesterase [Gracilibacillus ureilyticus]|uniref:Glycerophosphoryl diester phosphodiesterase n=1 Tax=Gracilibacillus ureilyticus TaxID=531814 RepID=A0A1H9Q7G1_9BACI|nr:glycerophosphodiester phosphodiesterase [Gracilibacillus ureilyticus]SER56370.1 glycerophosphoryl diester phosphodiesterase [Gracilibacillus ureilyticus]